MRYRDEQARIRLRELGQYLIYASEKSDELTDVLAAMAVPLSVDGALRENFNDEIRLSRLAKREYVQRMHRNKFFNKDLFSDPVWDILLDLYFNYMSGLRISVTSACIASQVPATTALRWIGILEAEGYVVREPDPKDHRRTWIKLTEAARIRMDNYFRYISQRMNNLNDYMDSANNLRSASQLKNSRMPQDD